MVNLPFLIAVRLLILVGFGAANHYQVLQAGSPSLHRWRI